MNALPFLLAAALTPRDQWHERWKHINRLAGMVAERSQWPPLHGSDRGRAAQALVDEAGREFRAFLESREIAGADVAHIRTQEQDLLDGLTKRVAECLMLGECEDIDGVEAAMEAFRQMRGNRS